MIQPAPEPRPQLLVFAEPLWIEGLRSRLERERPGGFRLLERPEQLEGRPQLLIWQLAAPVEPANLLAELRQLEERWQPSPRLLLLPSPLSCPSDWLLQLPVQGLLQDPEPAELLEAITTLLGGGRVVALRPSASQPATVAAPLGLGQWLLQSGLQQIETERIRCVLALDPPPDSVLVQLLVEGRLRELAAARQLLLWIWGPVVLAWGDGRGDGGGTNQLGPAAAERPEHSPPGGTAITLRERTAIGVWRAIQERLNTAAEAGLANHTGQLLALEGLSPERRRDLLLGLIEEFDRLLERLRRNGADAPELLSLWLKLQPELRRSALRQMAGSYVQLPRLGELLAVADTLEASSELASADPELPEAQPMLGALLKAQPLLVAGRLLAPDEPQALLQLEMLVSNWLIRNAELISAEVLACCGSWPELRRYLLTGDLLATRNLERLRNQLNAQQRWASWFQRPVQLYESQRLLYRLDAGAIAPLLLTEPRDQELRQLGWLQQAVTLALETRDAVAPQLQAVVQRLGSLVVVVLTQVIGRAIGLVGRGILQGLGRSVGRG
ncbi:MAG: DUF3685 domain-containing protein [Prochlorococcaceae cyanobacterium]